MPDNDPLANINVKRADADILSGLRLDSGYGGMENAVKGLSKIPGLTETILPSIQKLLMPGPDNPAFKAIDIGTQQNVASAQTDAMRRGLTGSDIEAASMVGARSQGELAKSDFQAKTSTQLASFIKDLATGDINAQRENLIMFAQLLGQKITNDQDLKMFRDMLAANMEQARMKADSAIASAEIGALGSLAGGMMARSDERLKEDITYHEKVDGVGIYSFRWKKFARDAFGLHNRREFGVLAQDVQTVYPDAVSDMDGWKAVDYAKLPASVFEAANRRRAAYA